MSCLVITKGEELSDEDKKLSSMEVWNQQRSSHAHYGKAIKEDDYLSLIIAIEMKKSKYIGVRSALSLLHHACYILKWDRVWLVELFDWMEEDMPNFSLQSDVQYSELALLIGQWKVT